MTGPVPPRVEAIRNQSISALRYIAEFVEDSIFVLLTELPIDKGTFDLAREFLRAEFYSDDIPGGFDLQSYKFLKLLVVGSMIAIIRPPSAARIFGAPKVAE
eukprot:5676565-Pyramimonas_sp.AAC.1